ncbi:MAG: dihydropteroate synthase-like protein [Methanomicrobiales archaeon]|nr:dihydropteroate synthase-like protein [Methanomicrobiales archaeon]
MHILLPTGAQTAEIVRKAAECLDADVVVTGEIASFLTPAHLASLLEKGIYDMVLVSGMCTASFEQVEEKTGVPVYRGPKHAADLHWILPLLGKVELSRRVPADEYLAATRKAEAMRDLKRLESEAEAEIIMRGLKIGGNSRMKVLVEVMDAHRVQDLRGVVERHFGNGADIVDLGFGFDATPEDVRRSLLSLEGIDRPLAIDTLDPALIRAGIFRADLVLSLCEENIGEVGPLLAEHGTAAVVIPKGRNLAENLDAARRCGVECLIADPILMPAGSGLLRSLRKFEDLGYPTFFGAGNVVELLDADSIGMNGLLASIAMEAGASVIFTSEHSDKTHGSVAEMRRAAEMMQLTRERPYPKDLGIDLLVLKEKRRRREPPLHYTTSMQAQPAPREIEYDPRGNFRIGIEGKEIVAVIDGKAVRGNRWNDVFHTILKNGDVSLLDHAAYLGAELFKAELAIRFGRSYEQDGPF